ncbi:MAG TPA: matrixin family metalloprotease [Gemmatimonadales bacterium]|jgi:predicted Zn-dependent protease|nr:matrixin family metalloprotease [Gemmatimonadales bacterium]
MKHVVLPLITFGLFAMVVADRLSHALAPGHHAASIQVPGGTSSAVLGLEGSASGGAAATAHTGSPSGIASSSDRLARLAARQQLTREGGLTYLDSLIISTDSVVRRWPDRAGVPLHVSTIEGEPVGYHPRMAGFVQEALSLWEGTGIGVRFSLVPDTTGADIIVRWIDHFDFDRAGQTDLTWDQAGRVRKAVISLAIKTNTGFPLPDAALLAVAVHEAGHALGLPHSADSNDVMFPATRIGSLSDRDRRTAQVLYRLPPGPVRDPGGTP